MKNISKIISIFFLSFSILFLCYIFYRSEIFHNGTIFDYYLKYYILAFLFIFISLICFFIPWKLKINITIIFISTLIGLYSFEGYFYIKNNSNLKVIIQNNTKLMQDNFVIYKNNTGKDYDKRTKSEIYQDLKIKNPDVVGVRLLPSYFLNDYNLNYLPLSGISNGETIVCNENGYYSIYQSDRYGFNNPDSEWNKDEIDFFLVGDSITQGDCVNEPDTISGNLRKFNNNTKGILNLAMGGNGPLIEYATLREYLPTVKVKRVLWMYFVNDLENLKIELSNKILVNYLNNKKFTQNLILKKQEIQKLLLKKLKLEQNKFKQEKQKKNKIINFLILTNLRGSTIERFFPIVVPNPIKEFENILKLSNEFTKQNNAKLYFVYIPGYPKYLSKNNQDNLYDYKKVIEIVKNLNIPIIDINQELLKKYDDPLSLYPFKKHGHFNEKGYRLVAKTIFNKIKKLEK